MIGATYRFIDDVTMYRVVLYALIGIALTSIILSAIGLLSFSPLAMILTLAVILVVSLGINKLFALVAGASTNLESPIITSLIIYFIVFPTSSIEGLFMVAITAAIAQASKYVLAIRGRHIFNPAAVAVLPSSLLGISSAVWWVGTPLLIPAVLVLGGLTVLKVRATAEVLLFFVVVTVLVTIISLVFGHDVVEALSALFISGPLLFAGMIMLTEPLTEPGTKRQKLIFAGLIGGVIGSGLPIIARPETALLIGNLFAFVLGQRRKIKLTVLSIATLGPGMIEISFRPARPLRFTAGQYIEITLPHRRSDSRGMRRLFSIASAPGDSTIKLGMNLPTPSSTFKQTLSKLEPGAEVMATRIGGSFTLTNTQRPIVLIAGGIGITPFRSMLADLLTTAERRPIILFYGLRDASMIAYSDVLTRARDELGVRVIPVVENATAQWRGETGTITAKLISKYMPSTDNAFYYISGSNRMVEAVKKDLIASSIPRSRIHTDHFTGY